jgi:ABC-type Zn uptake system ZnuABC Zn-binding protein ZnuA
VVTGVWALGQLADAVGGGRVKAIDVIPPGTDPYAALSAAQAAQVRAAAVVVDVGGGYQPSFEAAAAGAAHVVSMVTGAAPAARGPCLDPADLNAVAARLAAALTAADPAGRTTYTNGATDVVAEDSSLDADLHDSLSDCPRTTIVTPDGVFEDLASANGITDRPLTSSASAVDSAAAGAAAATTVERARVTTVFSEPYVDDAVVTAAARAAGVKVKSLDTLVGQPAGGYPEQADYSDELEKDLGVLTAALSCSQMGQP